MKPRDRSVYFSIFMSFPQPAVQPRRHCYGIFIGFPTAALTFLNQPPVVAIIFPACGRCGHGAPVPEEATSQIRAQWQDRAESLKEADMSMIPPAEITGLYRYPVKGLTPEPLQKVALSPGQTLPADRRYAIENGPSGFDPAAPAWLSKMHFLMLQRDEWLAALEARFDDATGVLTLRENGAVAAAGNLETAEGRAAIER